MIAPPAAPPPRIAVIIASKGRPQDLALWIDHAARQSLPPAAMIWALTGPADLPDLAGIPAAARPQVLFSAPGLTRQRNAGLAALAPDIDLVAFFDDDYLPGRECLAGIARVFAQNPGLVGVTGHILADGVTTAGIDLARARALIARHDAAPPPPRPRLTPRIGLYGCNMAYRAAAVRHERFDEALPLYGWQEDVDFAMRIARHGRIAATDAFAGVHRGAKGGRVSGARLGYSQVANIVYLGRKGTVPWRAGLRLMLRNIAANHGRALHPEPWVDRLGRARGNWLALADLLRGRLHPTRVLDL